ncbi:hypothetical protein L5515_010038 [Caenorhabditis briggsae]|uniref:Uncharacterized protein n=2 Tax=Caenorhabditis briggsae TaxID=6238 RepID=A0AAE9EL28_CAEBR|nr:hypothetical protein L5515_010038 [Caenorhabditis briggsae]
MEDLPNPQVTWRSSEVLQSKPQRKSSKKVNTVSKKPAAYYNFWFEGPPKNKHSEEDQNKTVIRTQKVPKVKRTNHKFLNYRVPSVQALFDPNYLNYLDHYAFKYKSGFKKPRDMQKKLTMEEATDRLDQEILFPFDQYQLEWNFDYYLRCHNPNDENDQLKLEWIAVNILNITKNLFWMLYNNEQSVWGYEKNVIRRMQNWLDIPEKPQREFLKIPIIKFEERIQNPNNFQL